MPMLKILVFFAAGIALAGRYELPPVFSRGGFRRDGCAGPVAALVGRHGGDAPHGGVRRCAAPRAPAHRAAGRAHGLRNHGRGVSGRPGPLCRRRCVGGGVAQSCRRTLACLRRPYPALRRFACGVACRGAYPLPGRGAAVSRRCGKLPPADGAAGLCRNPVDYGADAPRTPPAAACRIAPQGGRKALPAADERRGRGRRRGHGGGRTARRHALPPHGVLPERVVAPAGRIGSSHGDRFRTGQPRAVVAAAFQAGDTC